MTEMAASSPPPVQWIDEDHIDVDGTRFVLELAPAEDGEFHLFKPASLVRRYVDLIESERPQRIVELGVRAGGSTAFLALVARPEKLVAVDLGTEPPMLTEFLDRWSLSERVTTGFGLDQADRAGLLAVVEHGVGDRPLDLVLDDASHVLGPTLASFNALFPRLRPGGTYIIEDWSVDNLVAAGVAAALPADQPDRPKRIAELRSLLAASNGPPSTFTEETRRVMGEIAVRMASARTSDPTQNEISIEDAIFRMGTAALEVDLSQLPNPPRPMCDLATIFSLVAAEHGDVVAELQVNSQWLAVRRGSIDLDRERFDIRALTDDHFGYFR